MSQLNDEDTRRFIEQLFKWAKQANGKDQLLDSDFPEPNKLYLISNKDPEKRDAFKEAWYKYVKTQSIEDLKLWLNLEAKISEYEICSIIRDELELRNNE